MEILELKGIIILSRLVKLLTTSLVIVTVMLVAVTGTVLANARIEGPDFGIEVSPNILNINSYGNSGNIHSNIPVNDIDITDVTLQVNDEPVACTAGVDDCGHLVLKFEMDIVKGILAPPGEEVAENATFVVEVGSIKVEDVVPVISVP